MSEQNKQIAIAFYDKLINDFDPETAFNLYGGATYRQHTPVIEDGREGVTKFIHSLRETYPNPTWRSRRRSRMGTWSSCTVTGSVRQGSSGTRSSISFELKTAKWSSIGM